MDVARYREQDACPGALQVHQAADGALVRIRLPGGELSPAQLAVLAGVAADHGGGTLELTSRGSLQIRGITDTAEVAAQVAAAGLLPSATHERARNIVASPLSGRAGGLADVRPWVGELDAAIQADGVLSGLPGRFWFGIDDGRGDVSGLHVDAGVHALDSRSVALLVSGVDTGVRVPATEAAATLVRVAAEFQRVRGKCWRTTELDDPKTLVADLPVTATPGATMAVTAGPPIGWIEQHDGLIALGVGVPLGSLPARTAEFLAAVEAPLVITPWRSVLLCDLDEAVADAALRVLAPMGLIFDENSPWLTVSACTGRPGCSHSLADVRADASRAVESGDTVARRRHYAGCERACGSPPGGDVLVATADGYRLRAR